MWRRAEWWVNALLRFARAIPTLAATAAVLTVDRNFSQRGDGRDGQGGSGNDGDRRPSSTQPVIYPARQAPTEWHLQTLYRWDGHSVLTILGKPSWRVESQRIESIASLLLYHVTNDRELAEARAKAFADEVLWPLAGAPASILSGAVEAWLQTAPTRAHERPGAERLTKRPSAIQCSACGRPMAAHSRHIELLEVFGTLCTGCRTQVPV